MKANPLAISVILPVFFREIGTAQIAQLRQALQSIHSQKFPDVYEIILIDDGSIMPVKGLAQTLGLENTKYTRFVRNYRNQGLVYSLNRGLSLAKFPWIARLDADDMWLEGKIEKQVELIRNDPDLTISATGMNLVTDSGEIIEKHIRPGHWGGILNFFVEVGCPFPHGSVLARREIYVLLGGYSHDPIYSHCEDYALWSNWLRFFKPAMVEEVLYNYTISQSSVSFQFANQQRKASALVNAKFRSLRLANQLEKALICLASLVGCTVLEAGIIAFKMWKFKQVILLPSGAIDPLKIILNDCHVAVLTDINIASDVKNVIGRDFKYSPAGQLQSMSVI
jgi:glycosyltransferase involved in cell wall biosynthesis